MNKGAIGHRVVLPWAPAYASLSKEESKAIHRVDEFLRIEDGGNMQVKAELPQHKSTGQSADRTLDKRLIGLGLPYAPAPCIPEEDRGALMDEQLQALAVALDILTTLTKRMENAQSGDEVLPAWLRSLTQVGHLGGLSTSGLRKLITYAEGSAGEQREKLSAALMSALFAREQTASVGLADGPAPHPSSPAAVTRAITQLEDAAEHIIHDATLCLAAQEPVQYKKA